MNPATPTDAASRLDAVHAVTAASQSGAWPLPDVRQVTSDELFAGQAEVQIAHAGAVYRLRRTALGKLILTK